ncbi:MAG: LamG domain-containing protein [Cytophagaceae bacterium]|nr:LamG domain-containing protein [Cytophagaceae bacterium]
MVLNTPNLVAFWDFQDRTGSDRVDKSRNRFRLREVGGPVKRIRPEEGAPFGKFAADLKFPQRFELPRAEMGALNIHGKTAQVSVVAWIRRRKAWEHGKPKHANEALAGVWREQDHKRQYCLFLNIKSNAKMLPKQTDEKVSGHVSGTGGASPGHPWCYEVSLGATPVPWDEWVCVGLTYDGRAIRSYFNGAFDAAQGYNPYEQTEGIFDGGPDGADFVVGHSDVKRQANNQFVGVLGGVAVFDRALTEAEMKKLAEPVLRLKTK